MGASELAWKKLRWPLSYAAAKQRTARDPAGTAYTQSKGAKHNLWIKIREDRWLCFSGPSLDACLAQYARRPGSGGKASDHLIANGIATGPRESEPSWRVTQLVRPEPTTKPRALTAKLGADAIWRALEARGAPVVRRPVTNKAIAAAEKALKFRFPPSYIDLVGAGGAPAIGSGKGRSAESLSFAVLTPVEVVRFTREMRSLDIDMFEDPASLSRVQAQLDRAVLFQLGSEPSDGYVFLLDTADARGEMRVADYAHDYIEELDWRPSSKVVFGSLAASTLHVAKQIARDLP